MKISAVILTKNEEKNILKSVQSVLFLDEIIVVDDFSSDSTLSLIRENFKEAKIKIFERLLEDDFSKQRNFALEKAENDFVLFLDADEVVSDELAEEIKLTGPEFDGYFIKREDFMWGKKLKHGETGNIFLLRLANKSQGGWEGPVHETWNIKGKTRKLRNPIFHFPHQSISEFLKEVNRYTDLRAKELYDKGVKSSFLAIIFYTKGKFIVNYFLKKGFMDGIPGLLVALFMSFHSFLVRGKLWLLWQKR